MERPNRVSEAGGANIEKAPQRPLFEITLMRHAKPFYKDEGHDLTEEGVTQAQAAGTQMKESGYFDDSEVILVHSPTPRAKGTLEFVAEAAGLENVERRSIRQLRRSDIHDFDTFLNSMAELTEEEGLEDAEGAAKHHYVHPMHEEGHIIEKHSKKSERLYRSLENVARWFEAHPAQGDKVPHILAVSHFEIITHILNDVFGIENLGRYNAPAFAEYVQIKAFPNQEGNLNLTVSFNGMEKEVVFNRSTRSIEQFT